MKPILIAGILSSLFLAGCSPKDPAPNENVTTLYGQFHGKYQPIRSTSSEAIDVNLDGRSSTDMLAEIPQLRKEYGNNLELHIYGASKYNPAPSFLLTQWWPEQYIYLYANNKTWEGDAINYQPGLTVNYAMQGTTRYFTFSSNLKKITVQPNENENAFRWIRPESVTVNPDNTIEVVTKRRLYTSGGVKEVTITTTYERFTMAT